MRKIVNWKMNDNMNIHPPMSKFAQCGDSSYPMLIWNSQPKEVNDDVRTTEGATCIGPSTTDSTKFPSPHFPIQPPRCDPTVWGMDSRRKAFVRELNPDELTKIKA